MTDRPAPGCTPARGEAKFPDLTLHKLGFDAVKHLVLCRIEKRPPRLNLLAHPYLPRAEVATTSARSYMGLLKGAAP